MKPTHSGWRPWGGRLPHNFAETGLIQIKMSRGEMMYNCGGIRSRKGDTQDRRPAQTGAYRLHDD